MAAHISEERRLREVRKYYAPSDTLPVATVGDQLGTSTPAVLTALAAPVSSPNKTLTALMQLVSCRLGMQRAMVSIVEQHAQHFLAESTRSLDLEDSTLHEDGDSLWKGCGSTKRSEALCANTIDVPLKSDEYVCFSVSDLSKDERFRNLPYVAGCPNFKYYAGTPLLTQQNVPIGSVFVIDDRPRGPPTKFEIDFLGIMARNVMEYLEMRRESEMRIRNERMIKCLAAFVDGESTISEVNEPIIRRNDGTFPDDAKVNGEPTEPKSEDSSAKLVMPSSESLHNSVVSHLAQLSNGTRPSARNEAEKKSREEMSTQHRILSRASKLLRESLEVDYTIFLDMKAAIIGNNKASGLETSDESHGEGKIPQLNGNHATGAASSQGLRNKTRHSRVSSSESTSLKVLSFATATTSSHDGDILGADLGFRSPGFKSLRRLMKRYPEGKLWTFNDGGIGSSSEEDFMSEPFLPTLSPPSTNPSSKVKDATFLAYSFPGVRQILFAPVWDVETSSHIAACFAVSSKSFPVFDNEADTAFMRGFLNSVSITCSRAAMAAANHQKGDFISSISHELRSPLHGILASVELLTGSNLDSSQAEFCNIIGTCGQSLLETITDILEYTKINTLRKDARNAVAAKHLSKPSRSNSLKLSTQREPDLAAPSPFDMARVCEDAVTAISVAFMYHTSTPDQRYYRVFLPQEAVSKVNLLSLESKSLVVILDIPHNDWTFCGLAGSIQRIIMNLVGNSLKYTHSGFVKVSLSQHFLTPDSGDENELRPDTSMVKIVVTDTGRGISEEFLQTKLFSPFSQESTLAPGTGLGLNIVRSLVQLQQGTIDITSEVGTGTSVVVRLPLQRAKVIDNLGQDTDSILALSAKTKFSLQGFRSSSSVQVSESLQQYLTEWFDMTELRATDGTEAGITIVDEEELSSWIGNSAPKKKFIVVCDQARQPQLLQKCTNLRSSFELLTLPFGPHKLSNVLVACLENPVSTNGFAASNDEPTLQQLSIREKKGNVQIQALPIPPISQSLPPLNENLRPVLSLRKQARILCVDDNAINLRLLKTYMDKLGFQDVACAENGAIAFETVRLRPERFDLIFMDLSMPVCDGFESTSLIRSLEKLQMKVPTPGIAPESPALIVAVTGLASQRDQDAARAAGIDHFLSKPLKLSRLKELLVEWGIF